MSLKKFVIIAAMSIIINFASVYNAAIGGWSIVLLIFAILAIKVRDSDKLPKDKKLYGFVQTAMLIGVIFLSTGLGFIGLIEMSYIVYTYLADFQILLIVLAAAGLIVYYYLLIRLLIEAIHTMKQKGYQ